MSRSSGRLLLLSSLLWFATRAHSSRTTNKDVGMTTSSSHFDHFRRNQLYPSRPVNLPVLPDYKNDVPERQRTFFGIAPTRYETIIVRETVRPVCLLVDGNVPSCDHVFQNHNNNHDDRPPPPPPKKKKANVRRSPSIVDGHDDDNDYESYFIEPGKPNVKIQITEIPFRGTFLHWTGMPADRTRDDERLHDETPPLRVVRPIVEDAPQPQRNGHGERGRRQFSQNTLGAVGSAVAGGVGGVVANALSGAVANAGGAMAGASGALAGAGGALAGVGGALAGAVGNVFGGGGGGGGRPQVTVFVTRVDRTLDDRVTATLVPKNCMPSGVQANALRPCDNAAAARPYASAIPYQKQEHEHGQPSVDAAADIVFKVKGLVNDLIDARATVDDNNSHRTSSLHYGPV